MSEQLTNQEDAEPKGPKIKVADLHIAESDAEEVKGGSGATLQVQGGLTPR